MIKNERKTKLREYQKDFPPHERKKSYVFWPQHNKKSMINKNK